ncbi:hypothetical protein EVA_14565 [gut metagenome]|uniref:Uncharacterized protein n=1 Tax=gut metagenome TaxID=749906 RepID=J9FS51_9ZZZZ
MQEMDLPLSLSESSSPPYAPDRRSYFPAERAISP